MVTGSFIRLAALAAGAAASLLLIVSWFAKPKLDRADRIMILVLSAAAVWFGFQALELYLYFTLDNAPFELRAFTGAGRRLAEWALPALLAHLALAWRGVPFVPTLAVYLAGVLAWLASLTGVRWAEAVYTSGALALVIAVSALTVRRQVDRVRRRFHVVFGACVALVLASGARDPESAWFALSSVLPALALIWFVSRFNLFGVLIGRRSFFVLTLAAVSSLYLFAVRRIADFVSFEVEALSGLVEVALIFGAAVIWIPVYEWITRYFSRRAGKYAEFSKDIVERASRFLDMKQRLEFLAEQTGKLFRARRVLIWRSAEPRECGAYGGPLDGAAAAAIESLLAFAAGGREEAIHVRRTHVAAERSALETLGFNYAVPMWYESGVTGMLLVDTSPRQYLDENEPILLALSRQISHSMEACRLVEEKIVLERALLRQEHLASVGQLTATIAHEVKNPLSSIKTLAQLMREEPPLEQYRRDLDYIVAEINRLNKCVSQLLSYARPLPESGSQVSVHELLDAAVGNLQRDSANRLVKLEYEIEPSLREYRADRQTLQQIVLNLTLNAIQASPEGATVRFRAGAASPATVRIEVSDQGPGVPPGLEEKIFEPFFTTKQKGSGLGLAIVKKNLRQLRGDIRVSSPAENGRGAVFTVTFPAERLAEA